MDGHAREHHVTIFEIDHELAVPHRGRAGLGCGTSSERGAHAGEQLLDVERLRHVVVGSGVECRHLVVLLIARSEHDHGHFAEATELRQGLEPVHARKPEIEQHDFDLPGGGQGQTLLAATRFDHLQIAGAERHPERAAEWSVVLDDQDRRQRTPSGCCATLAAGTENASVAPPPGVSSHHARPRLAVTSARTIASPRPAPARSARASTRTNSSKIRSRSAHGIPGPWSLTLTSIMSPVRRAEIVISEPGGA